jgi:hypothetical protein
MTVEQLLSFANAWGRKDLDAVMSHFADESVFIASAGPEPGRRHNGRAEGRHDSDQRRLPEGPRLSRRDAQGPMRSNARLVGQRQRDTPRGDSRQLNLPESQVHPAPRRMPQPTGCSPRR